MPLEDDEFADILDDLGDKDEFRREIYSVLVHIYHDGVEIYAEDVDNNNIYEEEVDSLDGK